MSDTAELKEDIRITPMMQQYMDVKAEHQDALLFYRMGDFYELFMEDAVIAAGVLDIALTKRGKNGDDDIAMCGVPHHSYEPYLHKLIQAGYKVAICEQMESPEEAKKRGYKAVVRREVVRIITPGTIIEDSLLDARSANYLACLAQNGSKMALSWIDISTGEFYLSETSNKSLASDLARLSPKEILLADKLFIDNEISPVLREYKSAVTPQAVSFFDIKRSEKHLKDFYGVLSLDSFGEFSKAQVIAAGALVEYVGLTQKGKLPRLSPPKEFISSQFMIIDAATRRNLEINKSLSGEKKGSLINIIDKTITGAGARLLNNFMAAPLANAEAINKRLGNVQFFFDNNDLRENIREVLKRVPDIERALSRIFLGKGGPRDIASIRDGITEGMMISEILEFSGMIIPHQMQTILNKIAAFDSLLIKLKEALKDEVGVLARDGNFIAENYHPRLDELRLLRDNSRQMIVDLKERYKQETGVNTLKIAQNNVLGFYVEVTPNSSSKITDEKFIHRQTLANAVRYTTEELRSLENDILNAKDQALRLEMAIFDELVSDIIRESENIARTAEGLAEIDVFTAFAQLAVDKNYYRPYVDESLEFNIREGRHPVVEDSIDNFIANDADLKKEQKLWLLTGPNMAGKSTFLRQNALIAIMAQIGSFVPARHAHIGIIDKVFSRVGASDDLARGRSTFMVEMVETATILNQATKRSFVILDEIGRGTSTYDGLSIAWAVVEYLHSVNKSRGLFATHYHELTSLVADLSNLACYSMKVKEWEGSVVFMHEVIKGAADRSYGIHVAKLAGMPSWVIKRSDEVLSVLQNSEAESTINKLSGALPLFQGKELFGSNVNNDNIAGHPAIAAVIEELEKTDIDALSPKEALEVLYGLKEKLPVKA